MGFMSTSNPFSFLGVCVFNFEVKIYSNLSYKSPQSINASLRSSSKALAKNGLRVLAQYFESKTLTLYIPYGGDH